MKEARASSWYILGSALLTLAARLLEPHTGSMAFFGSKRISGDSYAARLCRARREGAALGELEAKLFRRAASGKKWERQDALNWLNSAIQAARVELEVQHPLERELEIWERAYRIAFLVRIV